MSKAVVNCLVCGFSSLQSEKSVVLCPACGTKMRRDDEGVWTAIKYRQNASATLYHSR